MTEAAKPGTRAELEATIGALRDELAVASKAFANTCRDLDQSVGREKQTSILVNDLKERLAIAESVNQRMRGYIDRVQEDDVVREDLVKVGDPEGEHQLVPKRKPARFSEPSPFAEAGCMQATDSNGRRDRKPPKHWVTY